jgi:hypothetical protein
MRNGSVPASRHGLRGFSTLSLPVGADLRYKPFRAGAPASYKDQAGKGTAAMNLD